MCFLTYIQIHNHLFDKVYGCRVLVRKKPVLLSFSPISQQDDLSYFPGQSGAGNQVKKSKAKVSKQSGVRLLTGMDRNAPERTGMDRNGPP